MFDETSPIKIVDGKAQDKRALNTFRNDLIVEIYGGLIDSVSPRQLARSLMNMPKQVGLPPQIVSKMFIATINLYKELYKQNYYVDKDGVVFGKKHTPLSDMVLFASLKNIDEARKKKIAEDRLYAIADNVFAAIDDKNVNEIFDKIIHTSLKDLEVENKRAYIDELKSMTRKFERVFYLCSAHGDCAIDHQPYQGKYYIAENWESIITDIELKKMIKEYVVKNDIKTFEEIIDKPVWLITRPHCRHYFKLIDTPTVLSGRAIEIILRNHKMWKERGSRQNLQTIQHPTSSNWYREENIREIIERYAERLDQHQKMYEKYKSPYLAAAIKKDKILIAKWKKYLEDNF